MTTETRIAPNSKESEMMVLGCMLTSVNSLNIAADMLDDSDFFYTEHKHIFKALKSAYKNDQPADVHLICEELKRQGKFKDVGGAAYITTLAQYAGTSAYIEEYSDRLKAMRMQRDIIQTSQEAIRSALDLMDPSKIILGLRESFNQIEKHQKLSNRFPIRFLNEFENNFLLTLPPNKPMLLEYVNEKGVPIGFLPKGIVAMIVGAGGIGKTHLLAQLAIAVGSGTSWLETYTTTSHCGSGRKGNVFFGLGENQYDDIHRVLYKASKHLRNTTPDLLENDPLEDASKRIAAFSFCGQQAAFIEEKKPSRYFYEFKMRLMEIAPKGGWDLIILDPVSRLMGADAEIDNAAATQFIALLEELTIDLPGNPTILFAHHVSKAAIKGNSTSKPSEGASQADSRGASALTDGVRWQTNFYKKETAIVIEMTKSNFTKIIDPIHLEREIDGHLKISHKEIPTSSQSKDSAERDNSSGIDKPYNRGGNFNKAKK
jgi:hypothetical protein